jgi:hypothetical protein
MAASLTLSTNIIPDGYVKVFSPKAGKYYRAALAQLHVRRLLKRKLKTATLAKEYAGQVIIRMVLLKQVHKTEREDQSAEAR